MDRYVSETEKCENCRHNRINSDINCFDRWYEMNQINIDSEIDDNKINCWEQV